jgi:hypothetical protein
MPNTWALASPRICDSKAQEAADFQDEISDRVLIFGLP